MIKQPSGCSVACCGPHSLASSIDGWWCILCISSCTCSLTGGSIWAVVPNPKNGLSNSLIDFHMFLNWLLCSLSIIASMFSGFTFDSQSGLPSQNRNKKKTGNTQNKITCRCICIMVVCTPVGFVLIILIC